MGGVEIGDEKGQFWGLMWGPIVTNGDFVAYLCKSA